MVTHYYPRKEILLIVRIEMLVWFLKKVCPYLR
jgi:hypothetical protein